MSFDYTTETSQWNYEELRQLQERLNQEFPENQVTQQLPHYALDLQPGQPEEYSRGIVYVTQPTLV